MSHKKVWEFLVGWMSRFNSSLMIWLDGNFARVFESGCRGDSPQPQPIDDIAGMRAVPWDDESGDIFAHTILPRGGQTVGKLWAK